MTRVERKVVGRSRIRGRKARPDGSGSWARRRMEVSFEMVAPAAYTNQPEPLCVAMGVVIAEVLDSSGMSSYRIAECTNLSRQEIWNLRRRRSGVDMKTAVIIGRAFFFSCTELVAMAEELARKASTRMD